MPFHFRFVPVFIGTLCILLSVNCCALTKTWTGATNTLWTTSTNWTGGVPAAGDQADIPGGLVNYPVISSAVTITSLNISTVAAGGRLTLNAGAVLSVTNLATLGNSGNGIFTFNAGTINFAGGLFIKDGTLTQAGGTINFNGNQNITFSVATSIFNATAGSAIMNGGISFNYTNGSATFFNLTINAACSLTQNNLTTLNIKGNFTNNGTFTNSNRAIVFNGTANSQTLSGSSTSIFNNLTFNNTFVGSPTWTPEIIFSTREEVDGTITLTSGIIQTTTAADLYMQSGSVVSGGSSTAYVDGPISKVGGTIFTFPLGNYGWWRRFKINPTGSATFRCQYYHSQYNSGTPVWNPINDVSMQEYWWLDETAGSVNGKVTLYWEDATSEGINDCVDLTIATWDITNYWVEESSTTDPGSTCSGAGTGSISSNTNSSSFGKPYTFASKSPILNPLPIDLISFAATPVENNVSLNWVTASETNNEFFTVQKTRDGIHYGDVVTMAGAGTSSQQHIYSAIDAAPLTGQSYYRLKQTDYNGQESFSALVPVFFDASLTNEVLIFPNPGNQDDEIKLKIFGFDSESSLEVFNVEGQKIFTADLNIDNSIYDYQLPTLTLAAGFYMVRVSDGMKTVTRKFQVL